MTAYADINKPTIVKMIPAGHTVAALNPEIDSSTSDDSTPPKRSFFEWHLPCPRLEFIVSLQSGRGKYIRALFWGGSSPPNAPNPKRRAAGAYWGGRTLERSAAPRVRCKHDEQLSRQMPCTERTFHLTGNSEPQCSQSSDLEVQVGLTRLVF